MKLVIGINILFLQLIGLTCLSQVDSSIIPPPIRIYVGNKIIDSTTVRYWDPKLSYHWTGEDTTTINYYDKINDKDLSELFVSDSMMVSYGGSKFAKIKRCEFLGFIGNNYQRFYVHFTSISKNNKGQNEYIVFGKTKVMGTICNFSGVLNIYKVLLSNFVYNSDHRSGIMNCHIKLYEDSSKLSSGQITGILSIGFSMDKEGNVGYCLDGPSIYEAVIGKWTSYKTHQSLICNWGIDRIPGSYCWGCDIPSGWEVFDTGAGYFWPNDYIKNNGWDNYRDVFSQDKKLSEQAIEIENETWWK